jgi:hypothetical protein
VGVCVCVAGCGCMRVYGCRRVYESVCVYVYEGVYMCGCMREYVSPSGWLSFVVDFLMLLDVYVCVCMCVCVCMYVTGRYHELETSAYSFTVQ